MKLTYYERQNFSDSSLHLACVASVSVWFRSKERPRNGSLGFGRARKETRAKKTTPSLLFYLRHFSRGL